MSDNTYRYLFPFEKVPQGANIVIYGAGLLGQEYLKQIAVTKYCNVIGFVDKNYSDYTAGSVPIYSPDVIHELDFDYVVVALRGSFSFPAIKKVLDEQNVPAEKIVCVFERPLPPEYTAKTDEDVFVDSRKMRFAIYMSGGIGDMITYKRFVEYLHECVPCAATDIFTVREVSFLRWLFADEKYVENIRSDLEGRYTEKKENYCLALNLSGCGLVSVDVFRAEKFSPAYGAFAEKIKKLQKFIDGEGLSVVMPAAVMYWRRIYRGENCYTGFNHGNIFSLRDFHVHIPQTDSSLAEYVRLNLQRYMTFNVENGTDNDRRNVSKTWNLEYFARLIKEFKKCYPDIAVVQLGTKNGILLQDADTHIMGQRFDLVARVLQNALFHLDTEGGLVHLASQLGTKCIVLFGPTPVQYFAYADNINVTVGDCLGCHGLYGDAGYCAKGQERPECMYKITPQIVMEHIDAYLREIDYHAEQKQ